MGAALLKTSGRVVDDIPKNNVLYTDLMFFEKHLKGVMPLEIVIDTKKKRGITNWRVLDKVNTLSSDILPQYADLSRPLSIIDLVKFSKQSFYNGDSAKYSLPSKREAQFIMPYMPKMKGDSRQFAAQNRQPFPSQQIRCKSHGYQHRVFAWQQIPYQKPIPKFVDSPYCYICTDGTYVFIF